MPVFTIFNIHSLLDASSPTRSDADKIMFVIGLEFINLLLILRPDISFISSC